MLKKNRIWLRAVEGAETGGSAGADTSEKDNNTGEDDQDNNTGDGEVDWKALYEKEHQEAEKWKAHSRKWEDRAKAKNDNDANGDASDIRARLAEVEENLREARAETERQQAENLRLSIGSEFGLSKNDVDLLRGNEDEMRTLAKRLADKDAQHYPENPAQGRGGQSSSKQRAEDWYAELTGNTTT